MPSGNRKGPLGGGPKTGRGRGYCAGYDEPGYTDAQEPRGLGQGIRWGQRGRGRGWRNRFNADFWLGRGRGRFFCAGISPEQENDNS